MERQVIVNHGGYAGGELGFDAGQQDVAHIVSDALHHHAVSLVLRQCRARGDEFVMLGGDHYGVDAHGLAVRGVFYGYLALGVGAQIGHERGVAAYVGELAQKQMAQVEGQRHVVGGLVAGVAEHHALVAGALVLGIIALYAAVDVGALLVEGREHSARFGFEFKLAAVVAYVLDDLACDLHEVNVGG